MIRFTAHYLVVKNEFCLKESVDSLRSQGVNHFQFCIPRQYWDGTPVSIKEIKEVEVVIHHLETSGCKVKTDRPIFAQGNSGAEKETFCRNLSLREIDRWHGSKNHVLVVDGDEIWRPGTVRRIEDAWFGNKQFATTVGCLSIIGFPGYPVETVADGLLVHVWTKHTVFSHARAINQPALPLDLEGVIHFTSTRKTRAETIEKHRKSTHYDDAGYDFEGWIRDVFPNIKPGMKDAHMYKHWQIWPKVREFSAKEWAEIPAGLRGYLGGPK
jgi:hypothetical protein